MARSTVLIVDDDREVQQYLTQLFASEGWKVLVEKDGDWAIKTFKSRRIDAIVLDILIPVLNGFQVADAIRADPRGREVPIVMLSGIYRGAEHRAETIARYGLVDYLNKPVEGDRLRTLLREALAKRESEPRPGTGTAYASQPSLNRLAEPASLRERQLVEREARALDREPVALQGNLSTTAFPRLLHELHRLQATGALFLMRDKVKKIIYVNNGRPTFVKSNVLRECLGQLLVAEGRLSPAECEASVAEAKRSGRRQGETLVSMGRLSATELANALYRQLESKLFDVFSWPGGEYQFRENASLPGDELRLRASCASLVYEGVRRFFTTERLEQELAPGLGTFPASAPDALLRFQRLDVDPPAEPILEALDGTRPVIECLSDPRWERRQALPVLYAVFVTGVVDLFDRANPTPAPRSHRRRMERFGAGAVDGLSGAKLEEFLASEVMQLKAQDHFRALGLTKGATSAEIEQAYDQLAWRFHPDVFAAHPATVLELAEGLFDRLKAAYVVLRSPVRRESYLAQLGEGR